MRFLYWLWKTIVGWFVRRPPRIGAVYVTELPDKLSAGELYAEGEGKHVWKVAMICPCGCEQVLEMNTLPDSFPRWQLMVHEDGTVTLHPSVWRQVGCRSHFFLRRGLIEWCPKGQDPDL
jgi:hypothetical protein